MALRTISKLLSRFNKNELRLSCPDNLIMKLFTLLILMVITFKYPTPALALLAQVSGKVEVLLPSGERMPLAGVRIYRTDWWGWSYCNQGGRQSVRCRLDNNGVITESVCCYGDQDGVEVITDGNGFYQMGNDLNNPGPVDRCTEQSVFHGATTRCLSGPKGQILTADDASRSCTSYNWCGINCGSNPHKLEPYFPADYVLPGNLSNLGYDVNSGRWEPSFLEASFSNNEQKNNFNFTFVLLGANPVETFDCRPLNSAVAFPTRVPSPTVPWSAKLGLTDKGGTLGKTNAEFENIIESWRQQKITAAQISAFITNLARVPGLQKTICDPTTGGCSGPLR